jgi:hypothetical protein
MRLFHAFFLMFSFLTATGQTPVISWSELVALDASEFGYTNLRMELDADGHPILLHGKSGSNGGLYCTRWNGSSFDAPVQVTAETGLFINDSEGPRMAVSGNKVAVGYQISGQWATGGRVVLSEDGGQTWGEPIPVSPGATEDHFMPVPAFDASDNPWVALKWGNAPALEGVLNWNASTGGFSAAVDASAEIPGDAVCECCASMPFLLDGRQYNLVRNNNNNIRDFQLARTDTYGAWTGSLDVDETDWLINSCPASEAEVAVLGDGQIAAVFMSAAGDGARTHWSTIDPEAWTLSGTDRIDPGQDFTENNPSIDADADFAVVAWERNDGGYDIITAVGSNDAAGMAQWPLQTTNATADLSGHSRRPVIRTAGGVVHLVYQRSSGNEIHYRSGTVGTSGLDATPTVEWTCRPTASGWRIDGLSGACQWKLLDWSGRVLNSGRSQNGTIETGRWNAGLLEIQTEKSRKTFKVIR